MDNTDRPEEKRPSAPPRHEVEQAGSEAEERLAGVEPAPGAPMQRGENRD